jgi:riboflavin transporter FmnP
MTICFTIMGIVPMDYPRLATLIFVVGLSAGFYIVPLQSLLQFLAPSDERGRFFGTANALSFTFISAAGIMFFVLRRAGMPTERMPLVCACLAFVGTLVGMMELNRIMAAQRRTMSEHDTTA